MADPCVIGGEKLTRVGNMKLTIRQNGSSIPEGPMLKLEGRMELTVLRRHGASIRELARVTGHSRNTVPRYLRGGEAGGVRKPATKRGPPPCNSAS